MESLDRLRAQLRTQSVEASQRNPQTARALEAKRQSVERVALAYQMIAYPVLDVAEARFGNNAGRDPLAHGPGSWKSATNELIADAIEHPGQNTEEFPNRGPITLSPAERAALGKLTETRGLPFDPQRAEYDYRELAPARQARMDETDRRLGWIGIDNAVDAGIYRPRSEIDEEIRRRQEGIKRKRPKPPRDGQVDACLKCDHPPPLALNLLHSAKAPRPG